MKICKTYLILILAVLFPVCLYLIFTYTNLLIPKRKEIYNPKGLASVIIKELNKQITDKDTLFIVLEKRYGICGSGMEMPSRFSMQYNILIDVMQNPYYINNNESFNAVYTLNRKMIITGNTDMGPEGCGCFYNDGINFKVDSITKPELQLLNLVLKKDSVNVVIQNFDESKSINQFNLVLKDDVWQIVQ